LHIIAREVLAWAGNGTADDVPWGKSLSSFSSFAFFSSFISFFLKKQKIVKQIELTQ
jgi:hypothetical protein